MLSSKLRVAVLTCVGVLLLAQGCSSPKPPPPPLPPLVVPERALEISVRAEPGLNPDARDRPTPVVVRIYELKAPQSFLAADFFSLFDKDQGTLGADMVSREELQLRPGDTVRLPARELKADVRAIGVFVAYRDIEKSRWRALREMPPPPEATRKPPPKPIPVPVKIGLGARQVTIE